MLYKAIDNSVFEDCLQPRNVPQDQGLHDIFQKFREKSMFLTLGLA